MRFIIHEQPYEKLLAAGQFRYEQDGRPAGTVETWRLTEVVDGYRFLRIDLDARQADSGESTLYHLTMNPAGRPERLGFRYFGQGQNVSGNILFDENVVTASRQVNGLRVEQEAIVPVGYAFWFPSATGLGLLAPFAMNEYAGPAVTLKKADSLALWPTEVHLELGDAQNLVVARQRVAVRPLSIRWQSFERTVWLDESGWPVQISRDDGLTAVETRYLRYK